MADIFEIEHERGFYKIYINRELYCTADTLSEANEEIEKYIEEKEQAAQLNWGRAIEHVRDVQYETYSPACKNICKKLLDRYHKGERSKNLYEQMMSVK